jgi:hypothetical protein
MSNTPALTAIVFHCCRHRQVDAAGLDRRDAGADSRPQHTQPQGAAAKQPTIPLICTQCHAVHAVQQAASMCENTLLPPAKLLAASFTQ